MKLGPRLSEGEILKDPELLAAAMDQALLRMDRYSFGPLWRGMLIACRKHLGVSAQAACRLLESIEDE